MTAPVALIAGGSSAIGAAVGQDLAEIGYDVCLWGRNRSALQTRAAEIATSGRTVTSTVVDVTDADAVARALTDAPAPTVAVWAVGAFDWAPAHQADPSTINHVLTTTLTAAAVFTRLVLPHLIAEAPSALVFIGSAAGHQAFPHNAAYVAAKHGLAGLARAAFLDVRAAGVKVSLVSPGLVAAGEGLNAPAGQQRPETLLEPADVAAAVRFVVTFPTRGCPVEVRLQTQLASG